MSELHDKLAGDLRLRGLARKTEIGYVQAVQRLERHCGKPADELTAEEVRAYFLHRVDQGMAASTLNVEICATKYLFEQTLKRDWDVWGIPPVLRPFKLPEVLSQREVHEVINLVANPLYRTAVWTTYECGLRGSETLRLVPSDIDSERMLIQVRCGKGRRDRYVALAQPTLDRLREHWRRFRPERHLFYTPRNKSQPVTLGTVQRAFKRAVEASSLTKKVTLHTLRHSYATHLLEHGVSLRSIQESLGHKRLQTTMRYTHIAEPSLETVRAAVESMTLPV